MKLWCSLIFETLVQLSEPSFHHPFYYRCYPNSKSKNSKHVKYSVVEWNYIRGNMSFIWFQQDKKILVKENTGEIVAI